MSPFPGGVETEAHEEREGKEATKLLVGFQGDKRQKSNTSKHFSGYYYHSGCIHPSIHPPPPPNLIRPTHCGFEKKRRAVQCGLLVGGRRNYTVSADPRENRKGEKDSPRFPTFKKEKERRFSSLVMAPTTVSTLLLLVVVLLSELCWARPYGGGGSKRRRRNTNSQDVKFKIKGVERGMLQSEFKYNQYM